MTSKSPAADRGSLHELVVLVSGLIAIAGLCLIALMASASGWLEFVFAALLLFGSWRARSLPTIARSMLAVAGVALIAVSTWVLLP